MSEQRKQIGKKNEPRPDELYLYGLSDRVVDSMELMYFDSTTTQVPTMQLTETNLEKLEDNYRETTPNASNIKECSVCHFALNDGDAARDHYKSLLHKLNLKRQISNQSPLTDIEFDKLVDDLDESISGSESDDSSDEDKLNTILESVEIKDEEPEDENVISYLNTKSPFIFFKSDLLAQQKVFGVYKSSFSTKELETPLEMLKQWRKGPIQKSALFMIGGGHFAGAIISHKPRNVKGNAASKDSLLEQSVDFIAHKTFHRYTTRRKQGGSQSASDNARGKANSAGSSIRRHNEAALKIEVRELLDSWKTHLNQCQSIYIRASGATNRSILVGYEGGVMKNNDPRIRSFPFTTKRATTSELKRSWIALSYMNISQMPKADEKLKKKLQKEKSPQPSETTKPVQLSPDELHTKELTTFMKKSRAPLLIAYLKKNKLSPDFRLEPESLYPTAPTLLHYASSNGLTHMVHVLLNTIKADPTILNVLNKTAAEVSQNKNVRNTFQMARHNLGESYCDWELARVGEPKSKESFEKEEEESKKNEEKEKKELIERETAKAKQEIKQEDNNQREVKFGAGKSLGKAPISLVGNLSSLSDEQKMRLMREQRARAAEARFKK